MIAVCTARNEADIIGRTVAHLYRQGVDEVIVADNLSTDTTVAMARAAGATVVVDDDPVHDHGVKMTRLAFLYAREGEWVVPFDADEYWWNLDKLCGDTPYDIVTASPHVHVKGDRRALMTEPQPKVAFRWREGAEVVLGNHWVENAGERIAIGWLDVCHHQYRTLTQVARKVCQGAEAMATLHPRYGSHWRDLAAKTDDELAAWWTAYQEQATVQCPLSPQ